VNFDCSCLWVRDAEPLKEALSLTPPFLRAKGNALDYKACMPIAPIVSCFFISSPCCHEAVQRHACPSTYSDSELCCHIEDELVRSSVDECNQGMLR